MRALATRKLRLTDHLRMHMAKECQDAANYIEALERALLMMPDDIEVFRLMRLGGRSRADQARVVAARIDSICRRAIAMAPKAETEGLRGLSPAQRGAKQSPKVQS